MAAPTLIYCAGGNRRFAEIAIAAGYRFGSQLPETVYHPLYFADQDWKRPNRAAYMSALAQHRPNMASVLDWEHEGQLNEVLDWAEEAAQYVERVMIIPKVVGGIGRIPHAVNGCPVILGYSVPTRFGGTPLPGWEFAGWPLHLLGGSPHRQMREWSHLSNIAEVFSVDGNMSSKMATRLCAVWVPGTAKNAKDRYWPTLDELDGKRWGKDAPYEAFRRSCENIRREWERIAA